MKNQNEGPVLTNQSEDYKNKLERTPYNVFSALGKSDDENTMSDILASLINPAINTVYWKPFFKSFYENVLRREKLELEGIRWLSVTREAHIDQGRIDILIWLDDQPLVIEVKVNASCSLGQLETYYDEFQADLFFLTLDGQKPGKEALGSLSEEQVKCLSWKSDIIPWLDSCESLLKEGKGDQNENLSATIRMFSQTIKRFGQNNGSFMSPSKLSEIDGLFKKIVTRINESDMALRFWGDYKQQEQKPDGYDSFRKYLWHKENNQTYGWYGAPFFYKTIQIDGESCPLWIWVYYVKSGNDYKLGPNSMHVSLVRQYNPGPRIPIWGPIPGFPRGHCGSGGYEITSASISAFLNGASVPFKRNGDTFSQEVIDGFVETVFSFVQALYNRLEQEFAD